MGRELKQGGMEADGITPAFEHRALEVVIEQHPGHSLPGLEGRLVAPQELFHAGTEVEAQEDPARVAQDHNEGHQRVAGPADGELAEVAPVHLGLLARQGPQAQEGLGLGTWAVMRQLVAEVVRSAGITPLAHHLVQAAGGERRELLEGLEDKRQVGIEHRWPYPAIHFGQAGLGEHTIDGVVVHAELAGDRAHPPLLDMVIAQDLGF